MSHNKKKPNPLIKLSVLNLYKQLTFNYLMSVISCIKEIYSAYFANSDYLTDKSPIVRTGKLEKKTFGETFEEVLKGKIDKTKE
jgi:hypothetical protein